MAGVNRLERMVTSAEDGRQYYRMIIPAGWKISVLKNQNTYNGYGFPFAVVIRVTSPDGSSGAMYHSTLFFTDDYLQDFPNGAVDDFGVLHRQYEGPEVIVAERGDLAFGSLENVSVTETVRDPVYNTIRDRREAEIREKEEADPLNVVENVTYTHVRREYEFTMDGIEYRGCFAATVEAVRIARWKKVPDDIGISLNDPKIAAVIEQSYPNIHYDTNFRSYIYTAKYGTDVHLYGQYACFAPAARYEDEYRTVFSPMIRGGAVICDDLSEELRINQDVIDRRNRAIREEKRRIIDANREAAQRKMDQGKAFREELQKTADTIRVTWFSGNSGNRRGN